MAVASRPQIPSRQLALGEPGGADPRGLRQFLSLADVVVRRPGDLVQLLVLRAQRVEQPPVMTRGTGHVGHVADRGRAFVEIRAGRLGTALPLVEALEKTAKKNELSTTLRMGLEVKCILIQIEMEP